MADAKERALIWNIKYEPGELLIKGNKNGNELVSYTLKTAGEPVAISAITDKNSFDKNKKDLAHIEINIFDKNGIIVYNAENEITVNIEGPATLLGLESGSPVSHEDYKLNKRKVLHGKLLAYIQFTQKAGNVKLKISSPGLQESILEIR